MLIMAMVVRVIAIVINDGCVIDDDDNDKDDDDCVVGDDGNFLAISLWILKKGR